MPRGRRETGIYLLNLGIFDSDTEIEFGGECINAHSHSHAAAAAAAAAGTPLLVYLARPVMRCCLIYKTLACLDKHAVQGVRDVQINWICDAC